MKKTTIILVYFFCINLTVLGQNIIGVLDYMKVDNQAEYLEVEKLWQKIHEARLEEGAIIGWGVYQVMYKTVEDPYNFVTVSFYDSFLKLNKAIPDQTYKDAYPGKTEGEWKTFQERTENSRKMLTSSIFEQKISCKHPRFNIRNAASSWWNGVGDINHACIIKIIGNSQR